LKAAGFVALRVIVPKRDVVYVRSVLEASDGVGLVSAIKGGDMLICGSQSRMDELTEVLGDLQSELGDAWLEFPVDVASLLSLEPT